MDQISSHLEILVGKSEKYLICTPKVGQTFGVHIILRVRFLFLRGGDERDGSPVGRAAYAAERRDLSIHCRDGFDGLRATNIEIARVERGYFLSSSSFSAAFWRE